MKKIVLAGVASAALTFGWMNGAYANGWIVSGNGTTQIGINDDGSIDANTTSPGSVQPSIDSGNGSYVGIGYNYTGQGGRTGFQDALTPGCLCEAWGVAATQGGTTYHGAVGDVIGNTNIGVANSSAGTSNNAVATATSSSFTSNTYLADLPGLTVTQSFSQGATTKTGALFEDAVTIHNGTGAMVDDVQYGRAMDWDVPPTEFAEVVTIAGTGTTSTLLHSTDDGFVSADPTIAISTSGIVGPDDSDGTTGPADHGSLFVFDFGSLAAGGDYTFDIFYGAGQDLADATALLSEISPELYSLGMSNNGTGATGLDGANTADPTFVFAFKGVGGSVIVPPSDVPEPATIGLFGVGLAGLALLRRRQRA